jgi:hypothetical protein
VFRTVNTDDALDVVDHVFTRIKSPRELEARWKEASPAPGLAHREDLSHALNLADNGMCRAVLMICATIGQVITDSYGWDESPECASATITVREYGVYMAWGLSIGVRSWLGVR